MGKEMAIARERLIEEVDLALPEAEAAAALKKACEEVGFFYLVNHGIDSQLLKDIFSESKKFFDLPLADKLTVEQDKNNRGYTPMEEEVLDPGKQSKGDTKEGYYIGTDIPLSDPRTSKPLHGPNQWPSEEWLPNWKNTMSEYHKQAKALNTRMIRLLGLALDLPVTYFEAPGMFDDPIVQVRLLHYSGEKSNPEKGVYGAGAHSDYGVFTFLLTDEVGGLQICRNKDAVPQVWEDVPPTPGNFIVNIGDMLERWTNNRFRSTLHRVLTTNRERYSIPVFVEPNFDCAVACLPSCCSPTNPPRYTPTTSGEYLLGRYRATHLAFDKLNLDGQKPAMQEAGVAA